jgi:hypothetical protein
MGNSEVLQLEGLSLANEKFDQIWDDLVLPPTKSVSEFVEVEKKISP